ncbi:MAG: 4Fe-4S dicluster domain-containing protein [Candidatus Thermoplasmatota archaeon]
MKKLIIKDDEKCVGCALCMYACARRFGEAGVDSSGILAVSKSGFERGATVIVCRACEDPICAEVCSTDALEPKEGGGVKYSEDDCIGCGNCVYACPIGAIFKRSDGKISVCVHCGYCVDYCPHDVLAYEERGTAGKNQNLEEREG